MTKKNGRAAEREQRAGEWGSYANTCYIRLIARLFQIPTHNYNVHFWFDEFFCSVVAFAAATVCLQRFSVGCTYRIHSEFRTNLNTIISKCCVYVNEREGTEVCYGYGTHISNFNAMWFLSLPLASFQSDVLFCNGDCTAQWLFISLITHEQ